MDDRDTEIRSPHARTDPRVSVALHEQGATLIFFFDPATAWTGEAPLLEVRLIAPATGNFEPWALMKPLPHYLQYARASLAREQDDVVAALSALRKVNSTRRGLDDGFLRQVAHAYKALCTEGEPYPGKALADIHEVDKSTASRWISAARQRGYLPRLSP
jgi:hypothetical protein